MTAACGDGLQRPRLRPRLHRERVWGSQDGLSWVTAGGGVHPGQQWAGLPGFDPGQGWDSSTSLISDSHLWAGGCSAGQAAEAGPVSRWQALPPVSVPLCLWQLWSLQGSRQLGVWGHLSVRETPGLFLPFLLGLGTG